MTNEIGFELCIASVDKRNTVTGHVRRVDSTKRQTGPNGAHCGLLGSKSWVVSMSRNTSVSTVLVEGNERRQSMRT